MLRFPSYVAGALLALVAAPALAADLGVVEVEPPAEVTPATSITGFYIGINAGETFEGLWYNDLAFDPPQDYLFAQKSGTVGVALGFDAALTSRIVGGVELRYDYFGRDFTPFEDAICCELATVDSSTTATVKLGYLVDPNTQIYAVLGGGVTSVTVPEGFTDYATESVAGYVLGLGAETRLWGPLTASVDARYFRATDTFETSDEVQFEPRYFTVTAGLKYRFGETPLDTADEVAPVDFDFTGFNMSLALLGSAGNMNRPVATPGAEVGPFWSEGFGLGLGLGYDFALDDTWVLGLEASLDYNKLIFEDPDQDSPDVAATTEFGTVDGVIALDARIGAKLNPSTLLYGKLGFAGIQTTADEDFFALGGGGDAMLPGYQVGLGIETAINDSMTLGVEGLYTKATDTLTTENTQLGQVELQPSLLTGKLTLKYHF